MEHPKSNFLIKNIKQNKKFSEFDLQVNVPNKKNFDIKKLKHLYLDS